MTDKKELNSDELAKVAGGHATDPAPKPLHLNNSIIENSNSEPFDNIKPNPLDPGIDINDWLRPKEPNLKDTTNNTNVKPSNTPLPF